ncbi:MAG: hypothetical protein RMK97_01870 [Sutterellaceae bacterium]|nr:hypothetical protein [Burkholderiaceae bacterium]MCX7902788.1 hypothetical protein [Burkholderiaceae bacterium]MDW8429241.1 hypothetical protein [Sutterellaceae bacterium]
MGADAKRRRWLQTGLAAPAVLTVSSASATVMSSFGRCLRNLERHQPAQFFSTTADGWFRKQVPVVQLAYKGHVKGHFYLDPLKNVYVSVTPPHTELSFGPILPPGWQITGQSKRWALVWFDKLSGTQYTKVTLQKPRGSLAATMSCYSSFRRLA